MRNFPYQATIITLIVAIGIWILGVLGVFNAYDAIIYNLVVSLDSGPADASPVLLITAAEGELAAGDPVWLEAVAKLEGLGAREIVFTFTPAHVSTRFYRRAVQAGNIVFGRGLEPSGLPDELTLAPWPSAVGDLAEQLTFGVAALPPAQSGEYRHNQVHYLIQNQDYPALATQAAKHAMGDRHPVPDSAYWVNFSGGLDHLPTVSLRSLLTGELIGELIRGKSVLIGPAQSPQEPGLHTPVDRGDYQGISLLAFHGFALQTLIRAEPIRPVPAPWQLVLLLALTALNVWVYQVGRYRFGLWLTVAAVGLYAVSAWVLPTWFFVWPPVTALMMAQIATLVLVSRYKFYVEELAVRRIVQELSGQLEDTPNHPGFYATDQPWTQVVNLVKQTLDLDWLIFLERPADHHHVAEVVALNCTLSDIDERRRDYRRAPYSDAASENRPIRMEHQLFLKDKPGVDQYIAPLLFGGELLGFWVMGIAADTAARVPDFATVLHDFSQQIAEILYHRRQWQKQQRIEQHHHTFRYLRLAGGYGLHTALQQTLTRYAQRLGELQNIFDGIDTAAAFFTPFGQAIKVNEAMTGLMNRGHLLGCEMTILDILDKLCMLPAGEGRRLLQRIFIRHETVTLPAMVPGDPHHRYLLHAHPIATGAGAQKSLFTGAENPRDAEPFELRGILVELTDVTRLHQVNELKTKLMDRIYLELRNDFQTILLASGLLGRRLADLPEAASYLRIIDEQIDGSITLLNRAQTYLFSDLSASYEGTCYPIGAREPLLLALQAVSDTLRAKRLIVEENIPAVTRLALADPDLLLDILQAILEILIADAIRGSVLSISMIEEARSIVYHFSAPGYGIPEAQFQDYLHGSRDEDVTPLFRRLRSAVRHVANWSGRLEGTSRLGDGLSFELRLQCFI